MFYFCVFESLIIVLLESFLEENLSVEKLSSLNSFVSKFQRPLTDFPNIVDGEMVVVDGSTRGWGYRRKKKCTINERTLGLEEFPFPK